MLQFLLLCELCVAHCNPSCVGVGVGCFKFKSCLWGCLCGCMVPQLHLGHDLSKSRVQFPYLIFLFSHWIKFLVVFFMRCWCTNFYYWKSNDRSCKISSNLNSKKFVNQIYNQFKLLPPMTRQLNALYCHYFKSQKPIHCK